MHRLFQKFIDSLSSAGDASAFAETMAITATALELSCFAYLALPRSVGKKPLVLSTYPTNWVEHYLRNHYERLDPIITRALNNAEPFRWGLGLSPTLLSPVQQEFLDEASQFGIRLGFTVPIHDGRGPVAALSFAVDQRRPDFERCIEKHGRVLQLMAMYFHAHVRRKLVDRTSIDGVSLSRREYECLEWASRGKSAWEIGHILGISRYTVASYLESAKEKLGVKTVVQAAIRLAVKGERQN
ncbi:LuxR family transcriptional regulator [Bradyrhizobium tunisiense]|uniref:LuxR family transcriptional regulator n=1 Tax=Bradyrhizobium tunisiense TaxID=3278709 RepID=UPI003D9C41B8